MDDEFGSNPFAMTPEMMPGQSSSLVQDSVCVSKADEDSKIKALVENSGFDRKLHHTDGFGSRKGSGRGEQSTRGFGVFKNNGYLMVSCSGGLNQLRSAICAMVAIARYLNVTLIVPELDKTSFWADPSEFQDIFDVDHFISSLRDEVRILKELPPRLKKRLELGKVHTMAPVSWSNISYYNYQVLSSIQKYKILHLNRTDVQLANNGQPIEIQKLRCRVNFSGLRFSPKNEPSARHPTFSVAASVWFKDLRPPRNFGMTLGIGHG